MAGQFTCRAVSTPHAVRPTAQQAAQSARLLGAQPRKQGAGPRAGVDPSHRCSGAQYLRRGRSSALQRSRFLPRWARVTDAIVARCRQALDRSMVGPRGAGCSRFARQTRQSQCVDVRLWYLVARAGVRGAELPRSTGELQGRGAAGHGFDLPRIVPLTAEGSSRMMRRLLMNWRTARALTATVKDKRQQDGQGELKIYGRGTLIEACSTAMIRYWRSRRAGAIS